eukprot:g23402.t1
MRADEFDQKQAEELFDRLDWQGRGYLGAGQVLRALCSDTFALRVKLKKQLKVVEAGHVWVNEATRTVFVRFTPTVPTCSVATLIGLTIKAKLLRSLPHRYKVDVEITPGTHNTEDQVTVPCSGCSQ